MMKKLQDYVNDQTEYINGVISSKDDQLESLQEQLQKMIGYTTTQQLQLPSIAEEEAQSSPALNMEGIEKIQHEINEKLIKTQRQMNIDVDVKVQDLSKQLNKLSDMTQTERTKISDEVVEVNDKIKRLALNAD